MYRTDLYRNSFWLMASAALSSLFGFFFWTIAAHFYVPKEVGLASTLISSVNLLVTISSLGFGIAFVRFLPIEKNKREIINSCLTSSGLLILILSLLFCLVADSFVRDLSFLHNIFYLSSFSIFSLFTLHNAYLDQIYVSQKVSFFTFLKNLIQSVLKVGFLFPLVFLGAFGIFSSFGLAMIVSFFASFLYFMRKAIPGYSFFLSLNIGKTEGLIRFAFANYIATLLSGMPAMLFPLIITGTISAEMTAYFYVAWMIGNLLFFIPTSIAFNFLAEGTQGGELGPKVKQAIWFSYLLLIPGVLIVGGGAHYLLILFGKSYAQQGTLLLRILAVASLFVAINSIGVARLNLLGKVSSVVLINGFIAIITIGAGYLLLQKIGLSGIGVAFLVSHFIITLLFISKMIKT